MDTQGTVTDENFWIRSMSNDTYLWYDEIVDVDPGEYADPLTYFSLMRTFALTPSGRPKDQFHFTYDSEEWRQLSQSGVVSGYGAIFTLVRTTPPILRPIRQQPQRASRGAPRYSKSMASMSQAATRMS